MGIKYSVLYAPLNDEKAEVRIVDVLPDDEPTSQIRCEMNTISLEQDPNFHALSYVWGDKYQVETISINGYQIKVTKNLADALRRIRRPDARGFSRLWVDAICINQDDTQERRNQVNLMQRIYSSAKTVIAWLGPTSHDLAFRTINEIFVESPTAEDIRNKTPRLDRFISLDWLQKYPHLCEQQNITIPGCPWGAVNSFLFASYWQRVWIFQEVALANSLIMLSHGSAWLSWERLSTVSMTLTLVRSMNQGQVRTLRPNRKPPFLSTAVWGVLSSDALNFGNIVERSLVFQILTSSWLDAKELESRRWRLSNFAFNLKATDPRDYIYGFLGITKLPITPNYSQDNTAFDVYTEYTMCWLNALHRTRRHQDPAPLRFLSYGGRGFFTGCCSQPSWMPNFTNHHHTEIKPTVTLSDGQASKDVFFGSDDGYPYIIPDTKSLFVYGVRVDKISSVCTQWATEITPDDTQLLRFLGDFIYRHTTYVTGIPPLQACLLAFSHDPSYETNRMTFLRGLAMLYLLTSHGDSAKGDFSAAVWNLSLLGLHILSPNCDLGLVASAFPDITLSEYTYDGMGPEDVFMMGSEGPIKDVWDKVLMDFASLETYWRVGETQNGYIGLVPRWTDPGDVVCVLKECETPVLLRKHVDGHFVFVGRAFIVGLMNGEAKDLVDGGKTMRYWYELR